MRLDRLSLRRVASKQASPLELLRSTILLDPVWYRESHPDLRGTAIDAAEHYLTFGAREGRQPHPLFHARWYLDHTPELLDSDLNPLVHYLMRKTFVGSYPHPLFDVDFYLRSAHVDTLRRAEISELWLKPLHGSASRWPRELESVLRGGRA